MTSFIPGIELSRQFYEDIVRHLIRPPHAAALIGEGSEVLGFDQPRSTDHSWGPRLQVFVPPSEVERVSLAVERGLPPAYKGYPVRFYAWQTDSVRHHVEVTTLDSWLASQFRIDSTTDPTPAKWLSMPQQHLLQFTAGAVFRDDTGELSAMRRRLSRYPADVWLWMMAAQWHLIGNTEHFLGRTAEANDVRGSRLVAGRLVRLLMELCFLQERKYWPYLKWFGTAFEGLSVSAAIGPLLDTILGAADHRARETGVTQALRLVAERHNALGVTPVVPPVFEPYKVGINDAVRPYVVLNAGSYAEACKNAIADPALGKLVAVGSIDQLTHADDAFINFTAWPTRLEQGYTGEMQQSSAD